MSDEPTVWSDLLAVAVQGSGRRAPDPAQWLADLPQTATLGGDSAERLLDASALATVARRAGAQSAVLDRSGQPDTPFDQPVRRDDRPQIPDDLLLDHSDGEAVRDLVVEAAARDLRLPPSAIVPVLERASRWPVLASPAMRCAGPLGEWLAARVPGWEKLRRHSEFHQLTEDLDPLDETVWRVGTDPAARLAWLATALRREPDVGLAIAAEALQPRGEPADVKGQVIDLLRDVADDADSDPGRQQLVADLLEQSLDARAASVRAAAAVVLARRRAPSALQARMIERAQQWLRIDTRPGGLLRPERTEITAHVPADLSPADLRDGFNAKPPGQRPSHLERAHRDRMLLWALVVAIPMSYWRSLGISLQALAEAVVAADPDHTSGGTAPGLATAFANLAVHENDTDFATALFTQAPLPTLVPALTPAQQVELVTRLSTPARVSTAAGQQAVRSLHWLAPEAVVRLIEQLPLIAVTAPKLVSDVLYTLSTYPTPSARQALIRVMPALPSGSQYRANTLKRALDEAEAARAARQAMLQTLDRAARGQAPPSQAGVDPAESDPSDQTDQPTGDQP